MVYKRKTDLLTKLKAGVISLFLSSCLYADMPVTFLPINYVTGGTYGLGYDLRTGEIKSNCVNFASTDTYETGEPLQKTSFEFAESTSEIIEKSNLSISTSLKILGGTTYKANSKTDLVSNSTTSNYNQTLLASILKYKIPKYRYIENISLKPTMLNYFSNPGGEAQFKHKCGDGFIIGIQKGREFVGTATVKKQTLKSSTSFANKIGIEAKGGWGNAKGNVDLAKAMESSFGSNNITVDTYSTGFNANNPTTPTKMQEIYEKFLSISQGEEKTVKLIVAPYNVLENYPYENPLKGYTKEDYLGMMVTALWDLKAAIRDAKFVLDKKTRNMFALGTKKNVKDRRVAVVRNYKDIWQKEYDTLLKAAVKCDKEYLKNKQRCESLATFYRDRRNLADEWDLVLPGRYTSDCYTPIYVNNSDTLGNKLRWTNFSRIYGDSEEGGSTGRIVVALKYGTDKRNLIANLSIAKIEWKRKDYKGKPLEVRTRKGESGWGLQINEVVYNLDNPKGLSFTNLNSCIWKNRNGIERVANIRTPQPYKGNKYTQFGFNTRPVHGLIDGLSGKDPRGQIQFGGGRGLLNSIYCEIDARGKNDDRHKCDSISIKDVRLALVSTQDREANNWRSPGNAKIPEPLMQFNSNKRVNVYAYKAKISNSKRVKVKKAKKAKILRSIENNRRITIPRKEIHIIKKRLNVKPIQRELKIKPIRIQ